ncbi:MAG: hypothetical protein ACLQOO_05645 [Terriglobia bacterium]
MSLFPDGLGWAATAVFAVSYFFKQPARLRLAQALAATLWIVYGLRFIRCRWWWPTSSCRPWRSTPRGEAGPLPPIDDYRFYSAVTPDSFARLCPPNLGSRRPPTKNCRLPIAD